MEQPVESLDSGAEQGTAEQSEQTQAEPTQDLQTEEQVGSTEASPTEAEDDGEEIDYDGEKYKVPKKLKDAFLRQQDYTQKTQSVAEQRKEVEQQAEQIKQQAAAQQQHIAEYAEAFALDSQLKQYQALDWQKLIQTDPVQAMQLDHQMRELQQRRDQVVASVTQKQQAQALQQQQETAKRLQEGRAVLEREIKGWAPGNEIDTALHTYVASMDIKDIGDMVMHAPKLAVLINKAYQFDQLMKKQATPKEKPEVQEKPVTRISASKGTAVKDPSTMTDKEFAQWRKRQIAQRH